MTRILIAAVGNLLRRDDGFGAAVAERLGPLPAGVEVVETGIGGIALVQELLAGCDGLIVIDAIDRGEPPGTLFVIEPDIGIPEHVPDVHVANPQRALAMAKGLGALPERVVIVGCQPGDVDDLEQGLTPPVARAVDAAARKVEETARAWA